jgi:hypothetical protein
MTNVDGTALGLTSGFAEELSVNPTGCTAQFVRDMDADGTLDCDPIVDADVPNDITVDLATVATTANSGDSATDFFPGGTIGSVSGVQLPYDGAPVDNGVCSQKGLAHYDSDGAAGAKLILCNGTNWTNVDD